MSENATIKELNDRNIYIKDIAEDLGIDISSISRVISGERNTKWIKEALDKIIKDSRRVSQISKFKVFYKGEHIDTVYFRNYLTTKEIKNLLVEEEGFSKSITVKKFKL